MLVEFHDLPLVDFNLMIKTGGAANPPEHGGPGRPDRHTCSTRGPRRAARSRSPTRSPALGATLSTGSTWDASNVSLSTLSKNLDAALAIFADVVQHPAFDDKEFERVRDNLLTAITRRKDSPPTVAEPGARAPALRAEAPLRLADGGRRGVDQEADARPTCARSTTPTTAPTTPRCIVAGDTTEAALRGKLEAAFQGWRSKHVAAPKLPAPQARAGRDQDLPHRQGGRAAVVDPRRPGRHRPQEPRLLPGHGDEPDPGRRLLPPRSEPARGQGLDLRRALELRQPADAGAVLGRRRVRRPAQRRLGRRDPQGAERHARRAT